MSKLWIIAILNSSLLLFAQQGLSASINYCANVLLSPAAKSQIHLADRTGLSIEFHGYPEFYPVSYTSKFQLKKHAPSPPGSDAFVEIQRLIRVSGEAMSQRRGWKIEEERMLAAEKHWAQTSYYEYIEWGPNDFSPAVTQKPEAWRSRAILGLTSAAAAKGESLPMHDLKDENTGASWRLELDKLAQEHGILFEGKAYATFKSDDPEATFGRDLVWISIFNEMKQQAAAYPKALEAKSFVTFGDETSLRFWKRIGFEVLTAADGFPPLTIGGTLWHALRIAPVELTQQHFRYSASYWVKTPGQNITVHLPNGLTAVADGSQGVWYPDKFSKVGTTFKSAIRQQIAPGIWALPGSMICIQDGKLVQISQVEGEKPHSTAKISDSLWLKPFGGFEIKNDHLLRAHLLAKPYQILDGRLTVPEGASLFYPEENLEFSIWGASIEGQKEIYPGVWIERNALVEMKPYANSPEGTLTVWVDQIARPLISSSGEQASAGSSIKLIFHSRSGPAQIETTRPWRGSTIPMD